MLIAQRHALLAGIHGGLTSLSARAALSQKRSFVQRRDASDEHAEAGGAPPGHMT
jgi:hypothetical protein